VDKKYFGKQTARTITSAGEKGSQTVRVVLDGPPNILMQPEAIVKTEVSLSKGKKRNNKQNVGGGGYRDLNLLPKRKVCHGKRGGESKNIQTIASLETLCREGLGGGSKKGNFYGCRISFWRENRLKVSAKVNWGANQKDDYPSAKRAF